MALQSKLSLFLYTLPSSGNPIVVNYSAQIQNLRFTTVHPGGCGQLTADLRIPDMDQPHPELALFSRVALMSPRGPVWVGETMTPVYKTDQDEVYTISALGIGNLLRDDPRHVAYSTQTIAQIITSEVSARSAYWLLSTDQTAIVPQSPANTNSPTYDGRYLEEIIADLSLLDGDDHWGVWPHNTQTDAAGFPLGQIQLHARDTTTITNRATFAYADVSEHDITPTADRAYNVVRIGYYDATQNPPVGFVTYTDPRLAGSGAQGTAPFRRRVYERDLSGISTVTKAQAQIIANAFGAAFQNISDTNTFTIIAATDALGSPLDLCNIAADHNIQINDVVYRTNVQSAASQLATTATAGQQIFYIVQTTYTENSNGDTTVALMTDNWFDSAEVRIARLQLWADLLSRANNKTTGVVQAVGAPETGGAGCQLNASGAAQTMQTWQPFRTIMTTAPSSITLTTGASTNYTAASVSATNITVYGFRLNWVATAAGATAWFGTYKTNGN